MTAEWSPTEHDTRLGQEGYMHYLSGVAILNTPDSLYARSLMGAGEHDAEDLLVHAEDMMYGGLCRVVQYANPRERGGLLAAEPRFDVALPHMLHTVDSVYDEQWQRIDRMNPAFFSLRPSPVFHQNVYRYLCHGRRQKIQMSMLLDGIQPAAPFSGLVAGRFLPARTPR